MQLANKLRENFFVFGVKIYRIIGFLFLIYCGYFLYLLVSAVVKHVANIQIRTGLTQVMIELLNFLLWLFLKKLWRFFFLFLYFKLAYINVEHIIVELLTWVIRYVWIFLLKMIIKVLILLWSRDITLRDYNLFCSIFIVWNVCDGSHWRPINLLETILIQQQVWVDVIVVGKVTKVFIWWRRGGRWWSRNISREIIILTWWVVIQAHWHWLTTLRSEMVSLLF